jgi:putative aminopeptidase FrvX
MIRINKLIETLSVPSYPGKEDLMRQYIVDILNQNGISNYTDKYGNVYATKGESEHYPCVVSHIDTVHKIEEFTVREDNYILTAWDNDEKQTGIGGDNKAGVFVCLELLEHFDVIKAAFFVSEEVGCLGSYLSDPEFFKNVGYAIQFDAPFNNWVSHYSDGVKLFSVESDFFNKINHVFENNLPDYRIRSLGYHPYTDVSALKYLYDFSCVNYSVGYYNMHSKDEYVSIMDVDLCLKTAHELIESLGNNLYYLPGNGLLTESKKKDFESRLNHYKNKKEVI